MSTSGDGPGQVPGWSTGSGAPLPPPPATGYGAPPPDPYAASAPRPYGAPPPTPTGTNGLAIASISCSLGGIVLGLLTCGILFPAIIVGIVLGHVALSQINRTGQGGRGLALTGIIAGYASIALGVLGLVLLIALGDSSST